MIHMMLHSFLCFSFIFISCISDYYAFQKRPQFSLPFIGFFSAELVCDFCDVVVMIWYLFEYLPIQTALLYATGLLLLICKYLHPFFLSPFTEKHKINKDKSAIRLFISTRNKNELFLTLINIYVKLISVEIRFKKSLYLKLCFKFKRYSVEKICIIHLRFVLFIYYLFHIIHLLLRNKCFYMYIEFFIFSGRNMDVVECRVAL